MRSRSARQMAAHRKLDRRRVYLCGAGLRERAAEIKKERELHTSPRSDVQP
jgi:hypothetical protein